MTGFSFDANILIDALLDYRPAEEELRLAAATAGRLWISRMVWIEVMSKGDAPRLRRAAAFLAGFGVEEVNEAVAAHAAGLRRQRPKLRSPDAIILASAQIHGRTLVSRNVRDFPQGMPGIRVPYTLPN